MFDGSPRYGQATIAVMTIVLACSHPWADARRELRLVSDRDSQRTPSTGEYKASMWQNGDSPDNGGMGSRTCQQGTISWDAQENSDFYIAKGLGCKPAEGKAPRKFHKGDKINVECYNGPLSCPTKYDGSYEMCQDISLLSIYDQTEQIGTMQARWITWNSESAGCYIFDDAVCSILSDEDTGDYSFQMCSEGYAPSKYQSGDKPDQSCAQGDLDAAWSSFFLAKGVGCKGDASHMTKFHVGDQVPGCEDSDYCGVSVYDGSADACMSIAVGAVAADNDVSYWRGDWITWNSESQGCYIWSGGCSEFSDEDATDSSFQYCGMT